MFLIVYFHITEVGSKIMFFIKGSNFSGRQTGLLLMNS